LHNFLSGLLACGGSWVSASCEHEEGRDDNQQAEKRMNTSC
jgi:hypothetical protein